MLFRSRKVINDFIEEGNKDKLIAIKDCEVHDFPCYLSKYGISYVPSEKFDSLLNTGPAEVFVVTRYPNSLQDNLIKKNYKHIMLFDDKKISYNNFVKLIKNASDE